MNVGRPLADLPAGARPSGPDGRTGAKHLDHPHLAFARNSLAEVDLDRDVFATQRTKIQHVVAEPGRIALIPRADVLHRQAQHGMDVDDVGSQSVGHGSSPCLWK